MGLLSDDAAYPNTTINVGCRPRVARMETQGDIDYINIKLGVWRGAPPEDRLVPGHAPEPFQYLLNPETVEEFEQRLREYRWFVMLWERELAAREKKKRKADAENERAENERAENERAANLARKPSKKASKSNPISKPSSSPAKRNFKPPARIDPQPMLASKSVPVLAESIKPPTAPTPKVSRSQLHHGTGLGPVEENTSKINGISGKRSLPKDEFDPPGTSKRAKKKLNSDILSILNLPVPHVKVEEARRMAERTRSVFREVLRRSRPDRVSTSFSDSSDSPSS